MDLTKMTEREWRAEGERRFGRDFMKWKFCCPVCHHIATVEDYEQFNAKGADPNSATCECIGRYTGAGEFKPKGRGPCNYAGYGLFRLSPVIVISETGKELRSFAFADAA